MHEMSLCEGILQVLEDQAKAQNYKRVKTVWLEIGALAGVEVSAMEFSYDVVCRGSIAEGSELKIIHLPATAWCMQCAESVEIEERHQACPQCGGYQLQSTGGDEMRIKELEVE